MGRRRKNKTNNSFIGIAALIVMVLIFVKITVLKDFNPFTDFNFENPFKMEKIEVAERSVAEDYTEEKKTSNPERVYVDVFFTRISDSQDVYVAISREKPSACKCSNLEYAVTQLIKGPNKYEQKQGIYTEIPAGTKLLSFKEYPGRININLSSDFEFGGGGDSLYKRVYQLIKTATRSTRKPVYLFIDGKQANVLGGEGLMLKQPLRSDSLDE